MRVVIVTHFVSPYQAEFFNGIATSGGLDLEVVYLHRTDAARRWTPPPLLHRAVCLDEEPARFEHLRGGVLGADVVVFNYYAERPARLLLNERAASGRPWCFWGERPGYSTPEWMGRLARRSRLSRLHASQAPIWGVGRFAVEQYQKEFGPGRPYCNMPYFSDLGRFQVVAQSAKRSGSELVFLFSGSLIRRKGVDLLGQAFLRLAGELPNVYLKIMGDGELGEGLAQTLEPVRDRVEFLGFKDWRELPACYAAADVLCVPSRYDGWGLVVPEGLASGLPVIGTNRTGAVIEFIQSGRNGWLIPAGDEAALFAAMREAAWLPSARLAELSRGALESVCEHSLQHGAERFIRAARETIENWSC